MHAIDQSVRLGPNGVLSGARVAVTGGAGFIGSHVVTRLLAAGADVKIVDDLSTGRIDKLREAFACGLADTDIRVCDVRSADCATAIVGWRPYCVVHLAAQASLSAARHAPLFDADVNIRGTVNVLDACVRAGVGLVVYATSSAIYGQVQPGHLPVSERTPIVPTSPYGLSKATALRYLDWYRQNHNLAYVALALGNVYGPRQFGLGCGVIARVAADILRGSVPTITGDGQQTRDFVHVADVADAIALACAAGDTGLFNIGSGTETTIADIFSSICSAAGVRVVPQFVPAIAGEARRMVLDISRASHVLGWRPSVCLSEGIGTVIRDLHQMDQQEMAT